VRARPPSAFGPLSCRSRPVLDVTDRTGAAMVAVRRGYIDL
jgi:hypothetical protein